MASSAAFFSAVRYALSARLRYIQLLELTYPAGINSTPARRVQLESTGYRGLPIRESTAKEYPPPGGPCLNIFSL